MLHMFNSCSLTVLKVKKGSSLVQIKLGEAVFSPIFSTSCLLK